jgi:hypothetical protein
MTKGENASRMEGEGRDKMWEATGLSYNGTAATPPPPQGLLVGLPEGAEEASISWLPYRKVNRICPSSRRLAKKPNNAVGTCLVGWIAVEPGWLVSLGLALPPSPLCL